MQAFLQIVPGNVARERKALSELGMLAAPASLAGDWQRILGYRRTLANELAELLQDAKQNDTSAIKALGASKKRVHGMLRTAATRSGFKACSEVG